MKTVLLFGFSSLPAVAAVGGALRPFGAEVRPVPRAQYACTLEALSQRRGDASAPYAGADFGRQMIVLCGLENELDDVLSALRPVAPAALKAVLTPRNRSWTPLRLFAELEREHRAVTGGKKR